MIKLFLLFSVLTGLATTIGHRHRHVLYVIFYWAGTKDFCPRKSWLDRKPTERRLDENAEDSIDGIRKAPAAFSGKYLWLWQERDVSIKLALLRGVGGGGAHGRQECRLLDKFKSKLGYFVPDANSSQFGRAKTGC